MFKKKRKVKLVVIIGCSRLGAQIAILNSESNANTVIIDQDAGAFKKLGQSFAGQKIEGNAEEKSILDKAKVTEATEVDVVTGDDDLAAMILHFYDVPHIIVRIHDEDKCTLLMDKIYNEGDKKFHFVKNPRIDIIRPVSLSLSSYDHIRHLNDGDDVASLLGGDGK
jgi:trk system potassium uptake protein TrkA